MLSEDCNLFYFTDIGNLNQDAVPIRAGFPIRSQQKFKNQPLD